MAEGLQVSIEQACFNALAAYLRKDLGSDVFVYDHWPEGNELPQAPYRALSIIFAGAREQEEYDPEPVRLINLGASRVQSLWDVATITQPLQLDVWASSDALRDDLCARLDTSLRKGLRAYDPIDFPTADPIAESLTLALDPNDVVAPQMADFFFDSLRRVDTGGSVMVRKYRAMALGRATSPMVIAAETPRMARINWKIAQASTETTLVSPTTGPYEIETVSSGGTTHSTGS